MNIAEFGSVFKTTTKVGYTSEQNLNEFDALIVEWENLKNSAQNVFPAKKSLRLQELIGFISIKKLPIFYTVPASDGILVKKNDGQYEQVSADQIAPVPAHSVQNSVGKIFDIIPKTPYSEFFEEYKQVFTYTNYFTNKFGKVALKTPHTGFPLSVYDSNFLFFPRPQGMNAEDERKFLTSLVESGRNSLKFTSHTSQPSWASQYYLPGEKKSAAYLISLKEQITKLEGRYNQEEKKMDLLEAQKEIFTGTGSSLESEIEGLFRKIGFTIAEVVEFRDDLILQYKELIAVVEIKGVSKSGAESHSAQLEKWCAFYYEKTGKNPKGVLIVNSFRETPLDERKEPSFPDQMLAYSKSKGHCLMTALQIFNIAEAVTKDPSKKEFYINSIFESVGIYSNHSSWEENITK